MPAEQAEFLAKHGWLASNALVGTPGEMEYKIAMPAGSLRLAVVYRHFTERVLSWWPKDLDDGCRNFDLIGGDAPAALQFSPSQWITVRASR
jgi:hypothetical protein